MIRCLVILGAAAAAAAGDAPAPVPVRADGFVVPAGRPASLELRAAAGAELAWSIADMAGRPGAAGTVTADAQGIAQVGLAGPAAGWHELTVGTARLGVVAVEPGLGGPSPDPFFAIDAAMAWLVPDAGQRGSLAAMAGRLGLAMARERLSWNAIQPAADRFDGVRNHDNDRLRSTWAAAGTPLLEVFHDAPAWLGRSSGKYPANLGEAAFAWSALGQRWAASTAAVEVWNEPDLGGFSGGGAPEHLVALTRSVAWGLRQTAPRVLVGGGVLTSDAPTRFRRRLWSAGLLSVCDFLSFHDYRDPRLLEDHVRRLRDELAAAGEPAMPLWISESGKAWPKGADRPDAAADGASALAIAMRAVEARACGIARNFAFVLPFYPENANNFGMTGRDGTPLRSLAAYSHVARRLAGLAYAGDLDVPGAVRARLFAGGARAVGVIWLGDPDAGRRFTPPFPFAAAFGLDGRSLAADADGGIPAPDGAVLLEFAPGAWPAVRTDTVAMRLARASSVRRERPDLPPVVVAPVAVPNQCEVAPRGWVLTPVAGGTAIRVIAWNLAADQPRTVRLVLRAPSGASIADAAEREVVIPVRSPVEVTWHVDPGSGGTWICEASAPSWRMVSTIPSWRDLDGTALLASIPAADRRALTAADLAGLDRNIAAGARAAITAGVDGSTRIAVDFGQGDRWAYPKLVLPAGGLGRFDAMVIRARCLKPAEPRVFVYRGLSGWYTAEAVFPADGAWHWTLVRLSDLEHCPATAIDPVGRLEPAAADAISLGFNSIGPANTLEVATWELVRLGDAGPGVPPAAEP